MPRDRSAIEDLRLTIDCLPLRTRMAMLEGVRSNEIIVGAYTDREGGVCPMLAAHRCGGRTNFISFAKAWDRFAHAKRARKATAPRGRDPRVPPRGEHPGRRAASTWPRRSATTPRSATAARPPSRAAAAAQDAPGRPGPQPRAAHPPGLVVAAPVPPPRRVRARAGARARRARRARKGERERELV